MQYLRALSAAMALIIVLSCGTTSITSTNAQEALRESTWHGGDVDIGKLFDAVVDNVEKNFFDVAKLKQVEWSSRAAAVRPSVLAAPTLDDAVRQINALLADLKTSHTALLTPDEYFYYILLDMGLAGSEGVDFAAKRFWGTGPYYLGTGAFTHDVDGRHFIDGILEGSPAERAGLRYGDEILSVDGMPYSPIAAFRGKSGITVELAIRRRRDETPERINVPVIPIRPTKAFSDATKASARVIERDGHRIGYVHIWASHEANSFREAIGSFRPDDAIRRSLRKGSMSGDAIAKAARDLPKQLDFVVIDVRGRVGGNIAVAKQFLEVLDQERKNYWGMTRTLDRNSANAPAPTRVENPDFHGRSVLLINRHTRSAAELMAHGFKRSGFGPLVGSPTAGAVSSGSASIMPGDLLLYVARLGMEFDGKPLEGTGVAPDHHIEHPLPYSAGADPVLDAALDLLVKSTRP